MLLKSLRLSLFISLFLAVIITACGSSESGSSPEEIFHKITPSERVFTINDFDSINFKISKEYDVGGLTGATAAWFGFWKPGGGDAKEFEIRFYASHTDAVEFGPSFADEGAGENAILEPEDARWNQGVKDRRYFFAGRIGTHGSGSVQPKYGGYAIYGNMVMLCEGANPGHSLDRCAALASAIDPQGSE